MGDIVEFQSIYKNGETFSKFTATIDRNQLSKTEISDIKQLPKSKTWQSGFQITISNTEPKNIDHAVLWENRKEYEEKFASYWIVNKKRLKGDYLS